MNKLCIKDITKNIKKTQILHGISLEVKSGEIVGLLGPNGAGKTTTFYTVCGLVKPTSGNVFFDDEDMGVDGRIFQDCTELIRTDTMRERKRIMEERADAFVIVPGGIGTFEEFFEVFTLKQLERHNKAIAILNVNGYYNAMIDMLEVAVKEKFSRAGCKLLYKVFDDVDETLDYIESYKAPKINVFEMKDVKK